MIRVIPELAEHPGAENHPESWQGADGLGVRVLVKTLGQALLQPGDLGVELSDHRHQGGDSGAHGLSHGSRGGQLGRSDQAVPRRADGSLYRYEMIFGGFAARVYAARLYADSVTELCEHLIPGYAELDDDVAQAAARIEHAVRAQVQLQADILAPHGMEGCTPAERELLLSSRHEPPVVGEWQPDVPLVLVDVYYEPLGPLPQPTGRPRSGGAEGSNLIWLRPGDEADLAESLAEVGLIVVSLADDENGRS